MKVEFLFLILMLNNFIVNLNCEEENEERTIDNSETSTTEADVSVNQEAVNTTSDPEATTDDPTNDENSKSSDICNNKPSKAMLYMCCIIPHGYYVAAWQKCSKVNIDDLKKTTECYNSEIKLVVDGKINKDVVKRLFNLLNTAYTKHWTSYIEKAVDECEYEEKSNLTEDIAIFYSCINDKLGENCQVALSASYCEPVVDYFDECRKTSCTVWPHGLSKVENCCLKPVIFGSDYYANCRYECSKKFFTDAEMTKCTNQCTDESQFFNDNDEYDSEKVKQMLKNSTKNSDKWEKVIDEGVDFCVKKVKADDNNTSHYHISHFISNCLSTYFIDNCVEFDSKHACQRVGKFMKKCPKLKPSENEHIGLHSKDQRVYSSVQAHSA